MSSPPPPMYQDPLESWTAKAQRKFKENPWVPIGCLATTGALVMSAIKMRQGHSQHMNYWLRARVALQGVTLVALVGGSMSLQQARQERALREGGSTAAAGVGAGAVGVDGRVELTPEQQRQKEVERREFAERMRAAEAEVEAEAGVGLGGRMTVRGPVVVKDKDSGSK